MSAIFISKRQPFERKNDAIKDMIQAHMALDIEVAIKTTSGIPVKTGNMRANVRHFKTPTGRWRVEADAGYSAVQEAGIRMSGRGAPTKPFSHYTMPGSSAGWFKRAIDKVLRHREQYIAEARKAMDV